MNHFYIFLAFITMLFTCSPASNVDEPLVKTTQYAIYKDKVVQGKDTAFVKSGQHIVSNYISPASQTYSNFIKYKFSINEKDNELPVGEDHWVVIESDMKEAPTVKFGEKPEAPSNIEPKMLPPNYTFTFRVDVSDVLNAFKSKGFFETFDGSRIAESDFKGFYIAGNAEPLSWDFVNLDNKKMKLQPTSNPNIYEITLVLNPYDDKVRDIKEWKQSLALEQAPKFSSDIPLVDAMFNMSMEEAFKTIEPDSTLRTGTKWAGVWTRDVSFSTFLAFAYLYPENAKISLLKKVKRGRIIQDTGSGGAWPISSDRTSWCIAAWEIYKVTGDPDWLNTIYPIIKNTLEDDDKTLRNEETNLYCGESSFLDWREQTYPKWMDNKDIFASYNLGTNAIHYQARRILTEIAKIKGDSFEKYETEAESIKKGMNHHFRLPETSFYIQYIYGRNDMIPSQRFEALGNALSILFEVADPEFAEDVIDNAPTTAYGTSCIFPQIPDIPPYHNNAVWPFVQAFWNLAAAKTENDAALTHGIASIYRPAALFLSNYENMVASTGDFKGTEINSDRMLWSIAGNLAMIYRVFLGMSFEIDGLHFNPFVPLAFKGEKTLTNFKYRNAVLDITVKGHGKKISSFLLDGKTMSNAVISHDLVGHHTVEILLQADATSYSHFNAFENHFSPATVQTKLVHDTLQWKHVENAITYNVYKNGKKVKSETETHFTIEEETYGNYMVAAVDDKGYEGFASEPILIAKQIDTIECETFAKGAKSLLSNFSGNGVIEISTTKNTNLHFHFNCPKEGKYLIDFKYSNGNGPWNTDNKCAIRSLLVNGQYQGVMVFPQRGQGEWSNWGYSNSKVISCKEGDNDIALIFNDWNNNMNVDVNAALLDFVRLIRLQD